MKKLIEDDVNKKNSITWTACNNDSRSGYWRNLFLDKFGGEFFKPAKYSNNHIWRKKDTYVPPKFFVFSFQGKEVKTFNLLEFCRVNTLTRSAIYDVMHSRRPQHKGYTFLREETNPEYTQKDEL